MKNHKFIIFGYDLGNALGQVRSLGEENIKSFVVLVSEKPFLVNKSKYVDQCFSVPNIEAGLELIKEKFSNEENKPFIYSDSDTITSLLDKNYDLLKKSFYFFNAGSQGRLTKYMNKKNICELAAKHGIEYPKSEVVKTGLLPKYLKYPIFTKSTDSLQKAWKKESFICYNEADLLNAYSQIEGEYILLQEYIVKKNEYKLEGLCFNKGNDFYLPIEAGYYRLLPHSYGSYLYFNSHVLGGLGEKIKQMLQEVQFSGIFEVEFLVGNDDKLYFLEINFRQSGLNYAFTGMGVNLSYIYAKSILKGRLDIEGVKIKKEPYNFMKDFSDFIFMVKSDKINFYKWLKDVYNTDCFEIWNKRDRKPFYSAFNNFIKTIFKKNLKLR